MEAVDTPSNFCLSCLITSVKPSIDNFLPIWQKSGGSEQNTSMTRKHSWAMAAVADLNEESSMDRKELNSRCQVQLSKTLFYSIANPFHPSAATSRSSLR